MPMLRHRAARAPAFAALLATAVGLAACGSGKSTGTAADPARAVPASAPLYLAADVRPSGSERESALADGRALTHEANPYLRLVGVLQTPGSRPLDFSRDVAPWLGPRAGVFLTSLASAEALTGILGQALQGGSLSFAGGYPFRTGGAQGAIVLDTTDSAKARSFLEGQAHAAGAHAARYRSVPYRTTSAGLSFGLVRGFAVIGSDSGLRAVVDTLQGGAPLGAAGPYRTLLAKQPAGTLAHLYAAGTSPRPAGAAGAALLAPAAPTNISLVPAGRSLALDIDAVAGGPTSGLFGTDVEGSSALEALPADSWLALGLGNVGSTLNRDVARLQALSSLGGILGTSPNASAGVSLDLGSLLHGLLTPLKILGGNSPAARSAFSSWMGSGGVFAGGNGLLELRAAAVISSKQPARSRAAVGTLAAQLKRAGAQVRAVSIPGTDAAAAVSLSGLPVVLDIADGRSSSGSTLFVLGLGEASVAAALHPSGTLAGSSTSGDAASSLGEGIKPGLIFNLPTLVGLLEGVGLSEDPTIGKVLPFLRSAGTLAGGGRNLGGGVQRYRLVLSLGGS